MSLVEVEQNLQKIPSFVSFVIYLQNNEAELPFFFDKVVSFIQAKFAQSEFIFVDNASTDNTLQALQKRMLLDTGVTVICLAWRHEHELAMLAGIDATIGDWVVEMETCIVDYAPQQIKQAYDIATHKSIDNVKMVANVKPSWLQRIGYRFMRKWSKGTIDLHMVSFRLVSRRLLNRVYRYRTRSLYRKLAYAKSGFHSHTEFYHPVLKHNRRPQKSLEERASVAVDALLRYTNFGYLCAMALSGLFLLGTAGMMGYVAFFFITKANPEGWVSNMLLLSGSFTGVFILLGIVIRYLHLILQETQQKDHYTYTQIHRLESKRHDSLTGTK